MHSSVLCLVALAALCGASLAAPGSLEAPSRRLFQGGGQPPVPPDVDIPRTTCNRPGPFGFFVSLKDGSGEHTCGGILISDGVNRLSRWVLTSAHCVDDIGNPDATFNPSVDIAGRKRDEPLETLETVDTLIHDEYVNGEPSLGFDVALLKLENTSCNRFPVSIAEPDFVVPEEGGGLTFIAFGREAQSGGLSDQLQAGTFQIIEREECEDDFLDDDTELMDTQLCSRGTSVVGVCQGDEGGPLVWSFARGTPQGSDPTSKRVVGIASFSDQDCESPDGAALFTSVSAVSQWINDTIANNSE